MPRVSRRLCTVFITILSDSVTLLKSFSLCVQTAGLGTRILLCILEPRLLYTLDRVNMLNRHFWDTLRVAGNHSRLYMAPRRSPGIGSRSPTVQMSCRKCTDGRMENSLCEVKIWRYNIWLTIQVNKNVRFRKLYTVGDYDRDQAVSRRVFHLFVLFDKKGW